MPPDAKRSPVRGATESSACRGGRPDQSTTHLVRPSLGQTDEERARRLAEVRRAIDGHHLACEAVRLLEGVARGPKVHRPRTMARALRELADHFEQAA